MRRWRVWARPIPADPFGPAGWAWFAAPHNHPDDAPPPYADGPHTPQRGDRYALRRTAHLAAHHERTHP